MSGTRPRPRQEYCGSPKNASGANTHVSCPSPKTCPTWKRCYIRALANEANQVKEHVKSAGRRGRTVTFGRHLIMLELRRGWLGRCTTCRLRVNLDYFRVGRSLRRLDKSERSA